jgi:hypothetical protein
MVKACDREGRGPAETHTVTPGLKGLPCPRLRSPPAPMSGLVLAADACTIEGGGVTLVSTHGSDLTHAPQSAEAPRPKID